MGKTKLQIAAWRAAPTTTQKKLFWAHMESGVAWVSATIWAIRSTPSVEAAFAIVLFFICSVISFHDARNERS